MVINSLKKRLEENLFQMLSDKALLLSSDKKREILENINIQEPKDKKFGDLSTNAPMVLASVLNKNPMTVAIDLKENILSRWIECENITIEKPGFINFNFRDKFIKEKLKDIVIKKDSYGFNDSGRGIKVHLEYVSSNPTGNLHIGHGRWGALGDSLANIYAANGYEVFREYYVNDYGTQIRKFADCVKCLYLRHFGIKTTYPEEGYPESTVSIVVGRLVREYGDKFILCKNGKNTVDIDIIEKEAVKIMVSYIKETLCSMDVVYDDWFYESSLYKNSNFEKVKGRLKEKNAVYEKDGALWFRSSAFGDDKDRVIVRSDGNPTYFASDILYLLNKAERGFNVLFYILGADHHGYVKRLKAAGKALGIDESKLTIIIGQLVRILRSGKVIKMSRRKGKLYTLRDLISEVGKDAVRYFFCTNSFDTPLDFDIGLAKQRSSKNPVYYVQYAHARIESIMEKIKNISIENINIDNFNLGKFDFSTLEFKTQSERELAKTMILYPDVIYNSCKNNAPYYLTQYLYRLASEFHYFYNHYRIIGGSKVNLNRLVLILLVRIVLRNALGMLNISAPKKM